MGLFIFGTIGFFICLGSIIMRYLDLKPISKDLVIGLIICLILLSVGIDKLYNEAAIHLK